MKKINYQSIPLNAGPAIEEDLTISALISSPPRYLTESETTKTNITQ